MAVASLLFHAADTRAVTRAPAALNTNAATDSGEDGAPQVTTDSAGNWVAVWRSSENLGGTIGPEFDILVSRSTNNGAVWTAPAALNTNASSDTGFDQWPQVTTDGAGNWVAVWESEENLGGTIGTDDDILYTNCSPLDVDCDGVPESGPGVPTPPGPPAVGGTVVLRTDPDAQSESAASDSWLPLPASVATGLLLLGAGGLYVVRMWRG